MPGGERRDADHMHIVLDRMTGHLVRRLKQRANIDVKADIGEGCGDYLGAPIVAVLPHFRYDNPRPSAFSLFKLRDHPLRALELRAFAALTRIKSGDGAVCGLITAPDSI